MNFVETATQSKRIWQDEHPKPGASLPTEGLLIRNQTWMAEKSSTQNGSGNGENIQGNA